MEKRICEWCKKEFKPKVLIKKAHSSLPNGYSSSIPSGLSLGKCCSVSCTRKKMWANPGEREKRTQSLRLAAANPETKKKKSLSMKKALNNPETRKRWSSAAKLAQNKPEVKVKISAAAKKMWANPEFKEKQKLRMKEAGRGPNAWKVKSEASKSVANRVGERERRSERSKMSNSKPEVKRKIGAASKRAWSDSVKKEERIKKLIEINSRSDIREKRSISLKQAHKQPGAYEKWSSAIRASQHKRYITQKQNKSFLENKSERLILNLLCNCYGSNNVIYQYREAKRYSFICDFYIKPIDLFIECNFSWTHGGEPYDSSNFEHLKRVKEWERRAEEINFKGEKKKYYLNAVDTWTKRDPLKVATAKKNNVNLKVFYTEKEAKDWINEYEKK